MARREFQRPEVLKQDGPRPYWYIRYRVKVLTGPQQIERKEKWHNLGSCEELTKRQAERLRDDIMRKVNDRVFTIHNQIPFGEFVKLYSDARSLRGRVHPLPERQILRRSTCRATVRMEGSESRPFQNFRS